MSRIYAREVAVRVATEGLRWIYGAADGGDASLAELETALDLGAVYRAQGGLLADSDLVAQALRGS
jgi:hypothetical protein